MKNVFFNDEVLIAEKKIISSLGISSVLLMENAGANSAKIIFERFRDALNSGAVIIAGKGSNAGDGFVIARHLTALNVNVKLLMLFSVNELNGDALFNYRILENSKSVFLKIIYAKDYKAVKKELDNNIGLIIDSVFGVGFKGVADLQMQKIIEEINSSCKIIISIDTPSCLSEYDQNSVCVKANETLSMGVKKFQTLFYNGKNNSGEISLVNIGISENEFTKYNHRNIFQTELSDIKKFLTIRDKDSNKYKSGKVFILAGSKGMTGAAYLCSLAAMKSGAGTVIAGIPESMNNILATKLTEAMTLPLPETADSTLSLKSYKKILDRLKWADTVLIGPGLSKNEETAELVRKIISENDLKFVLDADGISAFKGRLNLLKNKNIVMTPHAGEFSNLLGISNEEIRKDIYNYAIEFAKKYNCVLVLKNSPSVITDGKVFYINSTGRENLATAGTGDVLAGIIAGLTAQSKNILESSAAGVFIHGMCGDSLYKEYGNSLIASDLINKIAEIKNHIFSDEN